MEVSVKTNFVPTLDKSRKKFRMVFGHDTRHKKCGLDAEAVQEIKKTPDANARAEQPLFQLADEARRGLVLEVPEKWRFSVDIDGEAEGTLTSLGPGIGRPLRGLGYLHGHVIELRAGASWPD